LHNVLSNHGITYQLAQRVVKPWNHLPACTVDFRTLNCFNRSLQKVDFSGFCYNTVITKLILYFIVLRMYFHTLLHVSMLCASASLRQLPIHAVLLEFILYPCMFFVFYNQRIVPPSVATPSELLQLVFVTLCRLTSLRRHRCPSSSDG